MEKKNGMPRRIVRKKKGIESHIWLVNTQVVSGFL